MVASVRRLKATTLLLRVAQRARSTQPNIKVLVLGVTFFLLVAAVRDHYHPVFIFFVERRRVFIFRETDLGGAKVKKRPHNVALYDRRRWLVDWKFLGLSNSTVTLERRLRVRGDLREVQRPVAAGRRHLGAQFLADRTNSGQLLANALHFGVIRQHTRLHVCEALEGGEQICTEQVLEHERGRVRRNRRRKKGEKQERDDMIARKRRQRC